ncbi:MAG: hypothetical protein C0432_01255 [Candidatus Puniceispirillum sp.]|nr:hypothetical protein [Candidatus Pelagibacter sp.]MBA4282909.1 hypothetical protein [Candidatus Puniceispirillum sp.]
MVGSIVSYSRVDLNLFKSAEDPKEIASLDQDNKKESPALVNFRDVNLEAYAVQGQVQVTFQSLMSKIRETRKQNEIDAAISGENRNENAKEPYAYVERFEGYSDVYDELQELALQVDIDDLGENEDLKELQEFGFSEEIYTLSSKKDDLFDRLHYDIPYKPYVMNEGNKIMGQDRISTNEKKDRDLGVL